MRPPTTTFARPAPTYVSALFTHFLDSTTTLSSLSLSLSLFGTGLRNTCLLAYKLVHEFAYSGVSIPEFDLKLDYEKFMKQIGEIGSDGWHLDFALSINVQLHPVLSLSCTNADDDEEFDFGEPAPYECQCHGDRLVSSSDINFRFTFWDTDGQSTYGDGGGDDGADLDDSDEDDS